MLHFIDNMSALAGYITGGSAVPDSNQVFQLHALSMVSLGVRYWGEFVESHANPADEPSRCQDQCPLAAAMGADVMQLALPPLQDLWTANVKYLEAFLSCYPASSLQTGS